MGRPRIYDDPKDRKRKGKRIPTLFVKHLPAIRKNFPYGRKVTVSENIVDDEGYTVSKSMSLTTVKAYGEWVLFLDDRGVKHTYKYPELVKMGCAGVR